MKILFYSIIFSLFFSLFEKYDAFCYYCLLAFFFLLSILVSFLLLSNYFSWWGLPHWCFPFWWELSSRYYSFLFLSLSYYMIIMFILIIVYEIKLYYDSWLLFYHIIVLFSFFAQFRSINININSSKINWSCEVSWCTSHTSWVSFLSLLIMKIRIILRIKVWIG